MSNENLQMQIISESTSGQKPSSHVQFVSDSPITDPGSKVKKI